MKTVQLKGEPRQTSGTRTARAIRKSGKLPVVIYGHGEAPESIALVQHDVEIALKHGARTLEVDVNGQVKPYLIKNIQYDHFATTPIHMDLTRVDLTERVRVRVGIELRGVPKGIHDGGVLDQSMGQIEVECIVTEIPNTLHPVVTHLGLGESLFVKDLQLPPGVTPIAEPNDRIATVRVPIAEAAEAAVPAQEGEAATAEPERIGRIRKEEETGEKS